MRQRLFDRSPFLKKLLGFCRETGCYKLFPNIFRTLSLFKQQHLVHQLEDGNDVVRYELCLSDDYEEDEDMHVHFYCERCHQTYCFNDIPVPQVELPGGYEQFSINYMIKGICPKCAHRYYLK